MKKLLLIAVLVVPAIALCDTFGDYKFKLGGPVAIEQQTQTFIEQVMPKIGVIYKVKTLAKGMMGLSRRDLVAVDGAGNKYILQEVADSSKEQDQDSLYRLIKLQGYGRSQGDITVNFKGDDNVYTLRRLTPVIGGWVFGTTSRVPQTNPS